MTKKIQNKRNAGRKTKIAGASHFPQGALTARFLRPHLILQKY
jgi:hypothetical protein